MSRYAYDSNMLPSRPSELVKAFADVIKGDVPILVKLGGANVFYPLAPANKPPSGRWITVRERYELGGMVEVESGFMLPMIQVMTESRESIHSPEEASDWHEQTQDEVLRALEEANISVTTGVVEFLKRDIRPSPILPDEDDDTYYSTSGYRMTMGPQIEE